ncbi:MAG: hypothetical protein JO144_07995 [Actinobacteria bacterium]|nr:hypothetical protein [Actinomycetota bacterium]
MTYRRDTGAMARTLAYYQFARAFTTTNTYYWASASSLHAVQAFTRHMEPAEDYRRKLGLTQRRFDRRIASGPSVYREMLLQAAPWQRQSALMLLSSAFERYITVACSLAHASDPLLQPGFPKILDGVLLLKNSIPVPERSTEPLTKGEWPARVSRFREWFSMAPLALEQNLGELEKLRKRRNNIAHEFGLSTPNDLSTHSALVLAARGSAMNGQGPAVSEGELTRWLKLVNETALGIDDLLRTQFIGGYEIAALYVDWQADPSAFERRLGVDISSSGKGSLTKRFGKFASAVLGKIVTHTYATEVARYVRSL